MGRPLLHDEGVRRRLSNNPELGVLLLLAHHERSRRLPSQLWTKPPHSPSSLISLLHTLSPPHSLSSACSLLSMLSPLHSLSSGFPQALIHIINIIINFSDPPRPSHLLIEGDVSNTKEPVSDPSSDISVDPFFLSFCLCTASLSNAAVATSMKVEE